MGRQAGRNEAAVQRRPYRSIELGLLGGFVLGGGLTIRLAKLVLGVVCRAALADVVTRASAPPRRGSARAPNGRATADGWQRSRERAVRPNRQPSSGALRDDVLPPFGH